jgi:hypothetical protein
MNKRRETLRAAGWLAVLAGLTATAAAVMTDSRPVDLMGAYGLLLSLAGAWAVVGVTVLSRLERKTPERELAANAVPDQTGIFGH